MTQSLAVHPYTHTVYIGVQCQRVIAVYVVSSIIYYRIIIVLHVAL